MIERDLPSSLRKGAFVERNVLLREEAGLLRQPSG